MRRVVLGNHTAAFAGRERRHAIRDFYRNVLGCTVRMESDTVDRLQLDDVHFCFVWRDAVTDERVFLDATWLELKTDRVDDLKAKILAFGVEKLDVPDPHLYFQAPGGQVFRLVGINEDLSIYEGSASDRPAANGIV